ncbi:MAG TPA: LPS export ABC transporter permease LptG [Methylomirabilota bacterium]|jgi:lipopolysaccharide export system permease protein|nr:LPS export ABC transporter permease LptG [Methylomirabilota bacterium]
MSILDRYVFKELGPPFVIGVGVFTFFLFIDRIYQLTNLVITKNVPFHLVFSLLVFMLPSFLALTLPMALLVAVLLVCGRLAGDFEVTALKAAGVSPLRLLRPFVAAGLLVTVLIGCLTLLVNPWATTEFQRQLFKILQTRATTGVQERTFSAAFGQLVIYVEEITPSQLALKGVLVSDERDPQRSRIILAREGRLLSDEENRRVTLRFLDGSINETTVGDSRRFRYTAFSLYDMNLTLESPLAASARDEKPERMLPTGKLLEAAALLEREGQIVSPYYVELHKRLALPVAAVVFVLVGFPLGIRTQRGGRAVALASSFGIVVCYYFLYTSLESLALSRRLPAGLAIWMPDAVFGLVGVGLLRATTAPVSTAWMDAFWRGWARIAWRRPTRAVKPAVGRGLGRLPGPRASTFIIDRYLIREYVTFLGLGALVGAVLFIVVDLLQTLDRFLRVKPSLALILQHFAYNMPAEVYKGLPLIVLIATVFLFLSLTRQRELDAFKAAGISLYRISLPILLTALVISGLAVLFQEAALPELNAKAEEVDRVKIRGMVPRHLQRQSQIWYRSGDTRFLRMALLDPVEQSMDWLMVLDIDPDFRLVERLDARKARWTPDGWQLAGGVIRRIDRSNRVATETFDSRLAVLPEHIDDFTQVQKPPDTMSFLELRAFVAKLRESGHQVGKYMVQLYAKLSFPLVHFIMALVAIPFALASPRSGGRAVGIGVAIMISVGYWMVHSIALAFAQADLLPPALAAWTANIVFAGLGTALFLNART